MNRARKAQLTKQVLAYAGDLLIATVDSYEAFGGDNYTDEERAFIDGQMIKIGNQLRTRGGVK